MRIRTLAAYLIGNRNAILEIAADPWAAPIGFLFVLSAGLAREYDGADLVHEPEIALLPIPVSLAASFVLYCVTYLIPAIRNTQSGLTLPVPKFWNGYRMFLGLFWMTAPLAWLYAVPYERFLSELDAVKANLYTLAFVAIWRVALMCRVVTVLMGFKAWEACVLVIALGDLEALSIRQLSPVPLLEIMGGIRYSERELLLRQVVSSVFLTAGCSLPIWLVVAFGAAVEARPGWRILNSAPFSSGNRSIALSLLAGLSIGFWFLLLPYTQPEQILRRKVELLLRDGSINTALNVMSAFRREDFPPHWTPPTIPREEYSPANPAEPVCVMELILERPVAPWVREMCLELFARQLYFPYVTQEESDRRKSVLKRIPEGPELLAKLEKENSDAFSNYVDRKEPEKKK